MKNNKTTILKLLLPAAPVLILLTILVVVFYINSQEIEDKGPRGIPNASTMAGKDSIEREEPPAKLITSILKANNEPMTVTSIGKITASKAIDVTPGVSGVVSYINPSLTAGAVIKKGDILVSIDPYNYEEALATAKANVASAELSLDEAQQDADLAKSSWDASQLSEKPSALLLKQPQLRVAKVNLEKSKLALISAKKQLGLTKISAPFDMLITETSVTIGQNINTSSIIASAVNTDKWVSYLPAREEILKSRSEGNTTISTPGNPAVTLESVMPFIDPTTHQQMVKMAIQNPIDANVVLNKVYQFKTEYRASKSSVFKINMTDMEINENGDTKLWILKNDKPTSFSVDVIEIHEGDEENNFEMYGIVEQEAIGLSEIELIKRPDYQLEGM